MPGEPVEVRLVAWPPMNGGSEIGAATKNLVIALLAFRERRARRDHREQIMRVLGDIVHRESAISLGGIATAARDEL